MTQLWLWLAFKLMPDHPIADMADQPTNHKKQFISPNLLDRLTSSFNMMWPIMSPSLCKNLVEIGQVVLEI